MEANSLFDHFEDAVDRELSGLFGAHGYGLERSDREREFMLFSSDRAFAAVGFAPGSDPSVRYGDLRVGPLAAAGEPSSGFDLRQILCHYEPGLSRPEVNQRVGRGLFPRHHARGGDGRGRSAARVGRAFLRRAARRSRAVRIDRRRAPRPPRRASARAAPRRRSSPCRRRLAGRRLGRGHGAAPGRAIRGALQVGRQAARDRRATRAQLSASAPGRSAARGQP